MKNVFVLAALVTAAVPAAADENTVAAGPGGNTIRQSGTKAISAGWAGGADSRANLLYGLSESTMLDLLVGVNVTRDAPTGQTERQTVFGIDIRRMALTPNNVAITPRTPVPTRSVGGTLTPVRRFRMLSVLMPRAVASSVPCDVACSQRVSGYSPRRAHEDLE